METILAEFSDHFFILHFHSSFLVLVDQTIYLLVILVAIWLLYHYYQNKMLILFTDPLSKEYNYEAIHHTLRIHLATFLYIMYYRIRVSNDFFSKLLTCQVWKTYSGML